MKRTMIILGILLAALMLVVACAPKEVEKTPAKIKEKAPMKEEVKEEVKIEEPAETETTPEEDITVIEDEVVEIDEITGDLDMTDLDDLEKELSDLENLEI